MPTQTLALDGHIIDSLLLPKVLDLIQAGGGDHFLQEIEIGRTRQEPSHALIRVEAPDQATLDAIVSSALEHGASRV